ncbi:FERM, ARHGEF and pleckstrin domain-containing protein 2 isoform X1 [Phocoena sinus]|uniref:FERM, ARHGEF and pleckstrin domain-containing protein 2 isoform X1 n=2 Tax=Phocoena sinus TaxID=42100 RepID=UPI0013C4F8DF|nr:FERM, ARHGEF and pleckstrin domain-containing protein 2 isoform X1 [Phocoena sinus]XP_032494510.1 FERM, ARHGEF and pleckstrin domain-containing protein 2 isoform X1 [Phocoena sinus]XP_032494511.1 FERM, ARHGEF and pleckstrin domain-containing protein 2 isoform X1 [Phocoena sinus]XP_032494512.1 FERM, ARHGEF and pleckstrin domain-containing protein 2 isoform X1 [Phocoena sinus]XP_032494513.1 FERM, ARHGEF and pleckstrin domain-containing protein 2 isoform X1 [Phocoena sinus]
MGELEGTYRVLQTPGTRLGAQTPAGVSTLEPGHGPSAAAAWPAARTPIRVQLLDSSVEVFDVEPKCYGQVLLTQVWKRLNLIECDYFGLEFQNVQSCWIWLEPMKPIVRQVRRPKNTVLRLAVKFFPPDPGQLQEEYTRYLFALQLKRDLLEERLTCTDTTAALLASHLLQAEIGDYEEALVREHLRAHEYLPGQERALERILELHRGHAGQTPAESDFQVLEIARKLEMYGIRFHTASDREGAKINLAVSHMGVLVFQSCARVRLQMFLNERLCPEFQSSTKINTFNWSRLRKLSFKRKRFLIKLHPEVHGPYQDTLEFVLGSRDACKNFWKTCVEYHTFFRLSDQPKPRARAILFSRGSSFRYSGRTQKQLVDYVKDGGMKRIPYERKHSKTQMSLRALNANLPRQSVLFTEGTRTPASPSSTSASFCSGPASPPAPVGLLGSKDSSGSPTGPPAPGARWPAAERSGVAAAPPPGPPAFQPCQGLSVESPQLPSTRKTPPSLSPLGPAEQGSSPLLSPVLSDAGGAGTDDQEELRHKCAPADEAYFIAKEILATERTYLKDLEVITVWFRSAVVKADAMPADLMTLLFSNIDPIYEFHKGFLREVEQRLALWEGSSSAQATGDHRRIGDVLLSNMLQLKTLTRHFQRLHEVLTELEAASRRLRRLEALRRDFELQKVCYLPLNAFLLKPLQRLRHYRLLLRRLCAPDRQDPDRGDQDRADRREALKAITEVTSTLQHSLVRLENLQKLMELQRDLVGIENLIAPGREFIREGCLHKLTRKGPQQRMFFLFSDMLLYTGRGASGTSHFRIRGLLPLRGMLLMVLDPPVEERENERSVPHCFTIYAAQKTVVVAASTQLEKEKWMRDLNAAIDAAKSSADTALAPLGSVLCPHPRRPSDEVSLEESEDDARRARCSSGGPGQHRASTAMHVCWDRTTSISRADRSAAVENQLSGYLLRKFKNSSGWQKLWVVFTNFCLFFYKTHRDDCPLASLPLLGYSVSLPGEADGIHKEHVFKLQFKSHVYFFRAESKYTLRRWMEVIESASTSPGRAGTPEEEA